MRFFQKSLLLLVCLALCNCSSIRSLLYPGDRPDMRIAYFEHRVRHQGETLAAISNWYTGKTSNWPVILSHNPALNIHNIQLGQVILIPSSTLKKSQSMPAEFIQRWNGVQRVQSSPVSTSSSVQVQSDSEKGFASPLLKPVSNDYNVRSITGCERLSNNLSGLQRCAQLMNIEMRRIRASQDRAEYY